MKSEGRPDHNHNVKSRSIHVRSTHAHTTENTAMIVRSNSRRRRQQSPCFAGAGSALLLAAVVAAPMILLLLASSRLESSSLPWPSCLTVSSLVLPVDAADSGTSAVLKCSGGWDSLSSAEKMVEIPKSWINDGYCDCPYDGLDEPQTEACSGSSSWPGVPAIVDDDDEDDDDDGKKTERYALQADATVLDT